MNNKRVFILLIAAALPVSAFLLVDQVYRYDHLMGQVDMLHARQTELFEENKRTVVNIAILRAPERIDRIARELGLKKGSGRSLLEITLPSIRRASDG
jgi:cell division protein FtsL